MQLISITIEEPREPDAPREYDDPRPDLEHDSAAWQALLSFAWLRDNMDPHGIFGTLLGLRILGAGMTKDANGWRLVPGEIHVIDWGRWRTQYLMPHAAALKALLGEVMAPWKP